METQYLIYPEYSRIGIQQLTLFFYLIIVEHYLSPFLQKEGKQNVVKGLVMLKVQSLQNLAQKHYLYLLPNFHKSIFLLPK